MLGPDDAIVRLRQQAAALNAAQSDDPATYDPAIPQQLEAMHHRRRQAALAAAQAASNLEARREAETLAAVAQRLALLQSRHLSREHARRQAKIFLQLLGSFFEALVVPIG